MTMTLGEIKVFARDQIIQTDSTDVPNSLLVVFAREGVNRIVNKANNWPHLKSTWTFNTVADQHNYTLTSISANIERVTNILDGSLLGMSLAEMDHQTARSMWIGTADQSNSYMQYFSIYGGELWLWPKPNTVRSITVLGTRANTYMVADSDIPDLPTHLHEAVAYFVTYACYVQQEDAATAALWQELFNTSVTLGMERTFKSSGNMPVVLNAETTVRGIRTYEGWMNSQARG
jgi:hypothetical protein